jgi:hypothetical protein
MARWRFWKDSDILMNDSALLVFQYILEALDDPACRFATPKLTLTYAGSTVELHDDVLVVQKKVTRKEFNVHDPECGQSVASFLGESEEETISITFDGYYRIVSAVKVREAAEKARILFIQNGITKPSVWPPTVKSILKDLRKIYNGLLNASWPLEVHSDEGTDVWLDVCIDAWFDLFEYLEMEVF